MLSIIAAYSSNRVIGNNNNIPWSLPADRALFNRITDSATVIMGRNTYQSIYDNSKKPLAGRRNIVVSTTLLHVHDGFELVSNLKAALKLSGAESPEEEVFIIGGGVLYTHCLDLGIVDNMYLTEVNATIEGDSFFPMFNTDDWLELSKKTILKDADNEFDFTFRVLVHKDHDSNAIEII